MSERIVIHPSTQEYRDNFDRIFGDSKPAKHSSQWGARIEVLIDGETPYTLLLPKTQAVPY